METNTVETTTCNKWNIVLNSDNKHVIDDIVLIACKKLNEVYGYKYANIVHDMDTEANGEKKTLHAHIILWKGSRTRKTTLINRISEFIEQDMNTITVDPCINVKQSIRYLCHMDSPEKYQYLKGEIDSNVYDEVSQYLEDIDNDISGKSLYEVIKACDFDKTSVAIQLGPTKYCRWKSFIELFCK